MPRAWARTPTWRGTGRWWSHLAYSRESLRSRIARRPDELLLVQASGDRVAPLIPDGALMSVDLVPERVPREAGHDLFTVAASLIARRVEFRADGTAVLHDGDRDGVPEAMRRPESGELGLVGAGEVLLVLVPLVRPG